ncbi:hypothetical protein RUND412_008216 [Rhizina undulata]
MQLFSGIIALAALPNVAFAGVRFSPTASASLISPKIVALSNDNSKGIEKPQPLWDEDYLLAQCKNDLQINDAVDWCSEYLYIWPCIEIDFVEKTKILEVYKYTVKHSTKTKTDTKTDTIVITSTVNTTDFVNATSTSTVVGIITSTITVTITTDNTYVTHLPAGKRSLAGKKRYNNLPDFMRPYPEDIISSACSDLAKQTTKTVTITKFAEKIITTYITVSKIEKTKVTTTTSTTTTTTTTSTKTSTSTVLVLTTSTSTTFTTTTTSVATSLTSSTSTVCCDHDGWSAFHHYSDEFYSNSV